jgi:hypothetical protein
VDDGDTIRYTVHRTVDRYEIRDTHTQHPARLSFDCEAVAEACARLANRVEDATVAHLESWLAA